VTALLAVVIGGMAGAVARQELYSTLQQRAGTRFPVGILVVNLSGAFVLGLLYGLGISRSWPHWLATGAQTGAIGAYTTYSTWAVDSLALARAGASPAAAANLAGSLLAGVLLAWAGASLGSALLPAEIRRTHVARDRRRRRLTAVRLRSELGLPSREDRR
jgi:CrcB protein